MNPIPERIIDFIGEHHILTLAVTTDDGPWCATCFYAWLPERNRFVFTSDPRTRHIREAEKEGRYRVSGAIALETRMTGKIRGIQFSGVMEKVRKEDLRTVKQAYIKAFPVARFSRLHLWELAPGYIKMTDNRLGFGKKLIWKV